jgi:hypothetical protein
MLSLYIDQRFEESEGGTAGFCGVGKFLLDNTVLLFFLIFIFYFRGNFKSLTPDWWWSKPTFPPVKFVCDEH